MTPLENHNFRYKRAGSRHLWRDTVPLIGLDPERVTTHQMGVRNIKVTIEIPTWIERLIIFFVLLYRRLRYGYAFRRIPLTQGHFAIVDPQDYDELAKYNWRICKTKGKRTLYAERSIRKSNGKFSRLLMHRQIIKNVPAGFVIDHINGSGLDNRHANLRLATVAQNAANSRPRKSLTGLKGVAFAKDKNCWRASIVVNGSRMHLGYFKSAIDAAKAYDKAASAFYGDFARLNFTL